MTRRPMQLPSLLLIVAGVLALLALVGIAGSAMAPSVATAHPQTLTGAIPGATTAIATATATETRSDAPGRTGVTEGARMVSGRTVTATATRWLPQSTRTVVRTSPGSVVTATETATATRTETTTATATVTQTVTAIPTSAGVSP